MGNFRTLALGAAAALAVAAASPAAQALILTPGGFGPPSVEPYDFGGTVASTSGAFTSNDGASDFTGSYAEVVDRDPNNVFGAGDLTWFILISNNGPNALSAVTASDFAGFQTNVGYDTSLLNMGAVPDEVTRGSTGSEINFDFFGGINANAYTDVLVIQTDAHAWTSGQLSFYNSSAATVPGYAPAIPEPSTWAMMLLGFTGLGFAAFGSRRKEAVSIA